MSLKMHGMATHDAPCDDADKGAKERHFSGKSKWQNQPSKSVQHSVTFVSVEVDDEEIREKFSQAGHVTDIHKHGSRTFVRYNTEEEARLAVEMYKDELGASMAVRKDKGQRMEDGWKASQDPQRQSEKIEVRVLPLAKSASEEETRQEILDDANIKSYRFRTAQDFNLLYVDFHSVEDAQMFVKAWNSTEWRENKLSVQIVSGQNSNQGNSESRGKIKGDRQSAPHFKRKPQRETEEEENGGDVPRRENWDDDAPGTGPNDSIYPGAGNSQNSSFLMENNNNNNNRSFGRNKWQQGGDPKSPGKGGFYDGGHQGRQQREDPRSPGKGGFYNGGHQAGHPWTGSDSPSLKKTPYGNGTADSSSWQGKRGGQESRLHMKNQEQNGPEGNSLPNGELNNGPRSRRSSGQPEAPVGEIVSQGPSPRKSQPPSMHQNGRNHQKGKGLNGPSPQKLSMVPSMMDDLEMPPLESITMDEPDAAPGPPSPPMPALETVESPWVASSGSSMPPLEMAAMHPTDNLPAPSQAVAAPTGGGRIDGVVIKKLPSGCNEMVVAALLSQYKLAEISLFCNNTRAFVKFDTDKDAQMAFAELGNKMFMGERLNVSLLFEESENEPPAAISTTDARAHASMPVQKTWREILDHYAHITGILRIGPYPLQARTMALVQVTHIADRKCFWAQDMGSVEGQQAHSRLTKLTMSMQRHQVHQTPSGGRCSAKFGEEYHRGWMLCRPYSANFPVFFLDYGNVDIVPKENVKRLEKKFWELPGLALPFQLREGTTELLTTEGLTQLLIHEVDEKTKLATCSCLEI